MLGGVGTYTYSWTADGKELSRSDKFTVSDDLLGKTITVTVTDAEGNTATDTTAPVTGEAIVSEVKLDNITPAVGDKLTASAYDEDGDDVSAFCTWQWFRVTREGNVVKISNATKQSYTVGAIDSGAVLYCEATDINGNLLKSNESSVMKNTNVTQVNVNGMTGQRPGDKDKFVAIAGDELKVELVPYTATLDAGYQWYREGAAIKGATEATYVPTTADVNLGLSVKVTIPSTAGYGFSTDATTTNADLAIGTVATGVDYALAATVTLDDVTCWDLSNSKAVLDNTKPAVGDTLTVKVPFDKNGDGDESDTGDYLDLTSDTPDATVAWYRGSIEPKNWLAEGASYDVVKEDNGKALYVVVTGAAGSEFIGSCQGTTDEANKTVMSTEISRETPTVTSTADMDKDSAPVMMKGQKLYASTKDNNGDSVKDANLTFQWYRGGAAIDGATSSSYTLGDDDLKKFKNATNNVVTYRVVVNGKDGYTGSAKDTIDVKGAIAATAKPTVEDISVKRGDYYLHHGDVVNAGDELKLAASFDDSLSAMNVVWWYTANGTGTDVEQFTGTSFTVPSSAGTDARIAVSVTLKDDPGMWSELDFTTCTTNTTYDYADPKKTSSRVANLQSATTPTALPATAATAVGRVVYADATTKPTNWGDLTTTKKTGVLLCAKALDSITVTYKVADRVVTVPEVGATATVTVKPQLADLSYKWEVGGVTVDSGDNDETASGVETGEGANTYTIKRADVNKKIKVTVTAGDSTTTYAGASIKYESEEVVASSRTISAIKVLKYDVATTEGNATDTWYVDGAYDFLNDKKDFVNKKSVSKISTDETYIIVAMDSDGELIESDVSYNLYDYKSGVEKKRGSDQIFTAGLYFAPGDIAHFEVAPNQVGYTGSAATYNLSSAVSDGGTTPDIPTTITLTIEPDAVAAVGNANEDLLAVAEGASVPFTATVTGVDSAPSIKWFKQNGTQVKVGATYDPKNLTAAADGGFYAEVTVNGTTYTSDAWEIQKRVAVTMSKTSADVTANGATGVTATGDLAFEDQFEKAITGAGTLTAEATGTMTTAATPTATAGALTMTWTNAGVVTLTSSATSTAATVGEIHAIGVKNADGDTIGYLVATCKTAGTGNGDDTWTITVSETDPTAA